MRAVLVLVSLATLCAGTALAPRTALAQRVLDPRNPAAVSLYIRAQGMDCPENAKIERMGVTNRGALYLIDCPARDGKGQWRYQMILSPDESHISLYRCAVSGKCPIGSNP